MKGIEILELKAKEKGYTIRVPVITEEGNQDSTQEVIISNGEGLEAFIGMDELTIMYGALVLWHETPEGAADVILQVLEEKFKTNKD